MGLERDPKQIVTPYAFEVNPDLLGHPLATPKRRLAALLIDLFFAALLSSLNSGFLLFVLAVYLLHSAFRKTGRPDRKKRTRLAYGASGGVLLLLLILSLFNGYGIWTDSPSPEVDDDEIAETVERETETALRQQFGSGAAALSDSAGAPADTADRLIAALQIENELFREQLDSLADANEGLREDMENPGLLSTIEGIASDFGLTFGWVGFYLVVALAWGNGQTPGKWIMRIKVLRLNGKTLSFWYAFERTGGYAAGLATGLLGFLQVYWDANRQGIHDKIAGTVVVDLRDKRKEAARAIRRNLSDDYN